MGLVLDEFYRNITAVAVSAVTGEGMDELFEKIDVAAQEYHEQFRPMLEAKAQQKNEREEKMQQRKLKHMRKQMAAAAGGGEVGGTVGLGAAVRGAAPPLPGLTAHDAEEEEDSEQEEDRVGRKYSLGGIKAFEPDSDSDDDGEDDLDYMHQVSRAPPLALLSLSSRSRVALPVLSCCSSLECLPLSPIFSRCLPTLALVCGASIVCVGPCTTCYLCYVLLVFTVPLALFLLAFCSPFALLSLPSRSPLLSLYSRCPLLSPSPNLGCGLWSYHHVSGNACAEAKYGLFPQKEPYNFMWCTFGDSLGTPGVLLLCDAKCWSRH